MGKKILVVDDSATVRQQVGMALKAVGFEIVEAVDGQDGLEKITAMDDIALVVSDVNMPRMNGLDMVEKAKALRAELNVVMLTTEGDPALVKRAKAAGACGWIVKPFKAAALVAAAKKLAA
ncbi:MAG: response regulator [Nannocystaceae bacterium]|nr:response regulator [Nannocystaceae bacterium]